MATSKNTAATTDRPIPILTDAADAPVAETTPSITATASTRTVPKKAVIPATTSVEA
ncbi:hypothetical protein GCM10027414_34950 [Humibacter ginsengiterrae]